MTETATPSAIRPLNFRRFDGVDVENLQRLAARTVPLASQPPLDLPSGLETDTRGS
jgi:hypothetical protein